MTQLLENPVADTTREILHTLKEIITNKYYDKDNIEAIIENTESILMFSEYSINDKLRLLYIKACCRVNSVISDKILTDAVKARGISSNIAMELIVKRNLGYVRKMSSGGNGLDYEDALSRGIEGLWTAAMKYDADRGVSFISYARSWIYRNTRNRGNKADIVLPSLGEYPIIDKHYSGDFGDTLMVCNDVSRAMRFLDEKIRDVIIARFFMNKTIKEITEDLNICKETAIKRIRLGCDQLKENLKGYEYGIN